VIETLLGRKLWRREERWQSRSSRWKIPSPLELAPEGQQGSSGGMCRYAWYRIRIVFPRFCVVHFIYSALSLRCRIPCSHGLHLDFSFQIKTIGQVVWNIKVNPPHPRPRSVASSGRKQFLVASLHQQARPGCFLCSIFPGEYSHIYLKCRHLKRRVWCVVSFLTITIPPCLSTKNCPPLCVPSYHSSSCLACWEVSERETTTSI
jgi:hypothetical protein